MDTDQTKSKQNQPMLLVPNSREEEVDGRSWSAHCVFEGETLDSSLLLPCHGRRFCGSSEGWLFAHSNDVVITLYKPSGILGTVNNPESLIRLPPLFPDDIIELEVGYNYLDSYVMKVSTFTPDPLSDPMDLICVVIFGEFCELAYIRPKKDNTWTRMKNARNMDDVIYYNDKFYAMFHEGELVSFDPLVSHDTTLVAEYNYEKSNIEELVLCYKSYVVELHGGSRDLLLVRRYADYRDVDKKRITYKFRVFKLSIRDESMGWVEIASLGNNIALFLGDNCSISIDSSKYTGCRGNCIYFTHDNDTRSLGYNGPSDMGMFDLKSGSITSFSFDAQNIAKMKRRVPIWFVPNALP